jgi:hypothetical protein
MSDPGDMVTLVCPQGSELAPISHGTISYAPYREDHTDPNSRWLVTMPRHVAAYFCRGPGGFRSIDSK